MGHCLHNGITRRRLNIEATCARIGRLIDKSGLDDKQLAEMMNVTVQAVNKWRHGRSIPDISNLYTLSRILGVGLDDLMVEAASPKTVFEYMLREELKARRERCLRKYAELLHLGA